MKFSEIETIDDVRKWVEEHPNHIITAAWQDMLIDGEDDIDAFFEEADYQMYDHGGELEPDELIA